MSKVVTDYFSNLFSRFRPEITIDDVDFIPKRVTQDMAAHMSKSYHRMEVEAALAEMHPYKSPGPDGFPALFYKSFWDTVGDDVCDLV